MGKEKLTVGARSRVGGSSQREAGHPEDFVPGRGSKLGQAFEGWTVKIAIRISNCAPRVRGAGGK